MMIPVFRPSYGEEEFAAVREVMASGWVGLGPKTAEFEKKFADYIGVRFAVALNSGTAALHLALMLADVKGKEVITTPLTFISTNHAILYNQAKPVFADIEADTLNIDPKSVSRLIGPNTAAIICVHYGGHPCRMEELLSLAKKHKLILIEDAAHGTGGQYRGGKLGSFGDFGCFSFHAVKNLATGEGGMVTTNSAEANERLRMLRWLGINKDTWSREGEAKYSWQYNVEEVGFKCHMHDISAAIGIVQLRRLAETNGLRAKWAAAYTKRLKSVPWLEAPVVQEGTQPAWHNYVIKTDYRDELNLYLAQRDISTGVHYIPNNQYDMYRDCPGPTPVCDRVWQRLLTLPLYPDLAEADFEHIVSSIREFR